MIALPFFLKPSFYSNIMTFAISVLMVPVSKTVFDLFSYKYTPDWTGLYRTPEKNIIAYLICAILCGFYYFQFFIRVSLRVSALQSIPNILSSSSTFYTFIVFTKAFSAGFMSFCKVTNSMIAGFIVLIISNLILIIVSIFKKGAIHPRLAIVHICEFTTLILCYLICIARIGFIDEENMINLCLYGILGMIGIGIAFTILASCISRNKEISSNKIGDTKQTEEEFRSKNSDSERAQIKPINMTPPTENPIKMQGNQNRFTIIS